MTRQTRLMALVFIFVLLTMHDVSATSMPGTLPEPPWGALERELIHAGVRTDVPSLIEAMRSHPRLGVRWMAADVLGLMGEKRSKEALSQAMNLDKELLVRETAAAALARLGDSTGLTTLKKFMETSTIPVRQFFLAAQLAEFGDPSGYPYVIQAITSDQAQLRYMAVASLPPFVPFQGAKDGIVIDPVERLLALTEDNDPKIRKEVLIVIPFAVAKGASMEAIRPIVEKMVLNDPDQEVREKARSLLVLLQSK